MKRPPAVSVVIPTYQRCASLARTLGALSVQTIPYEDYEVVVSIDGSSDGTREMVIALATPYRLRGTWQPNRGRAAACNAGVRESAGELIVILDDDMEPCRSFLAAHLAEHEHRSRAGVLGAVPIHLDAASPPRVQFVGAKFNRHLEALARPDGVIDIRGFYSGNFSIRRQLLLEVGGFDESFRLYGHEDVDLAVRLLSVDVELLFSPEASAVQHYEKSLTELACDHMAKGKTAVLCARKHPQAVTRLRLGTFGQRSRKWRFARAALLSVSDRGGRVPRALTRILELVERQWPARLIRYYPFALDYFFWFGARSALREAGGEGLKSVVYGSAPRGNAP